MKEPWFVALFLLLFILASGRIETLMRTISAQFETEGLRASKAPFVPVCVVKRKRAENGRAPF